jgi:epoxyqueuosine reductase
MHYVRERLAAYADPSLVLPHAQSILMLALPGAPPQSCTVPEGAGRVASYATGTRDYHDVIHEKLQRLKRWLEAEQPGCRARGVVDSAPLLERQFAQLAGLGWQGKNTLLLHRQWGSSFFLAALLMDIPLPYDTPFMLDHCGNCTACLDACPTQAFPQPYVLDATRCISYLTIEQREAIPLALRPLLDDWVFGCDVCQAVCPWNRKSSAPAEADLQPLKNLQALDLIGLFALDEQAFRLLFRRTPLWRARLAGLLRNAAIALGNQRCVAALPALRQGLTHADARVREACQWAIEQLPVEATVLPPRDDTSDYSAAGPRSD